MAALYAGDPSFIPGVFVPMEKTSSVRGGERDRPSRTRYGPIPGRLVADIHVGEQSGKACRALRSANLGDWGTKEIRNERMIGLEIPSVVSKLRGKPNEMDRLNLRLAPGVVG